MRKRKKPSELPGLPGLRVESVNLITGEFECRCTKCKTRCRQSFDIMTCCGCSEIGSFTPKCVETYAPIPTSSISTKCNHMKGNQSTLAYDSSYEMRASDMHCTQCGKSGSRTELESLCFVVPPPHIPAAAEGMFPTTDLFFGSAVIEACSFEWPQLTGKLLEIVVGESNGHTIVLGKEKATGHVYVLHQHYHNALEEY